MAQTFRKLAPYPYVRLRTEIYFGSREPTTQNTLIYDGAKSSVTWEPVTYVPALFTYFREILDNALDEVGGRRRGKTVFVTHDPKTMVFTVADDGEGIPIRKDKNLDGIPASVLLSEVQAGSNFDESELSRLGLTATKTSVSTRGEWAGANGVGGSVVNFTSSYFIVEVWRDGKHFIQRWDEGVNELITTGHKIKDGSERRHGTRIEFSPSKKVFKTIELPENLILSHLWMVAAANYGRVKIVYNGTELKCGSSASADEVRDTILKKHKEETITINLGDAEHTDPTGFSADYYLVPNFVQNDKAVYGMVNNVPTFNGGTHIDGFESTFYPAMAAALREKFRNKLNFRPDDIRNGLLVVNVTKMRGPDFDSQSKSKLQNNSIVPVIRKCITDALIQKVIRANPKWVSSIAAYVQTRMDLTDGKELAKKQKEISRTKVAKLSDATGRIRPDCTLFIGEGDSALTGLMSVRDPKIHGCLPLLGKITNAHKVKVSEVLNTEAYSNLISALGLTIGRPTDRSSLRYGRLYIAADEDEDGKHITGLIINFLYRFWPELFDPKRPFVYRLSTPLIIASKKKEVKYFFADDYEAFRKNSETYRTWDVVRAKGLGALRKVDWQYVLKSPRTVAIVEDGQLKETLDLIFNTKRTDDRKEWLSHD